VKSVGTPNDTDSGEFEAIVSVFGNVDSYGEVVMPGAFTKSLAEWKDRGDPIPVIWSHQWADPFSHVGIVKSAEETDKGLLIKGFISPEERASNPTAAQVYSLLKSRRVTQFSFGFDVEDGGFGERGGEDGTKSRDVYELRQLALHEVGPCLLGVNPETELLGVKASGKSAVEELLELTREILANQRLAVPAQQTTDSDTAAGGNNSTDETQTANETPEPGEATDSSAGGSTEPAGTPSKTLLDLAIAEAQLEDILGDQSL
jgi:HK97 family phage prohead protease